MFMGPLEQMKPWSMKGVEGVSRFLARVWRLMMDENQAGEWELSPRIQDIAPEKSQLKIVHATIKKVTEDIESLSFNTAISQMMVFVNAFTNVETDSGSCDAQRCWSCSIPSRRISLQSSGKNCATKFRIDARRHHRAVLAGVMTKHCWWKTKSRSSFR